MKTKNEWAEFATLLQAPKKSLRPDGPGWKKREEISKATGISIDRVSSKMNAAVRAGTAERFIGNDFDGSRNNTCVWFRIKNKP
jgi:hypothetical protein